MSPQDHNKSLVILHASIGAFYTLGLVASPLIIAQNYREQIPTAIFIFGTVFIMAVLFWSTAIAMHRRKPLGRKLSFISAPAALVIFWPVAIYTWWFMHSEGGKRMYGASSLGHDN
jgi:hypothetical protein